MNAERQEVESFLDRLYSLCPSNKHKAVDLVYDFMDDSLLAGNFEACDRAFKLAEPGRMLLSCVFSFLIITERAKGRLSERAGFLARAVESQAGKVDAAETIKALRKHE